MSDAYLEFQTENSERRFPFIEDSSLMPAAGPALSDGVVLDVRGFHRERPEMSPQLVSIDGGASGAPGAVSGSYRIVFNAGRSDAPLTFSFLVPEDTVQWPLRGSCLIVDPIYPECSLGRLDVTFGAAILDTANNQSLSFQGTAVLEPSTVAQLYRTQVDFIRLIHLTDDDEYVGGNLVITPGYNMDVLVTADGIKLLPSPGAGLGRFVGTTNPMSVCEGAVLSVNGQRPNSHGEFFIKGGRGIRVTNLPDEHKIRLSVDTSGLGGVCE